MAEVIQGNFSRQAGSANKDDDGKPVPCYQFLVTLAFSDPPIWRRIQVPGGLTLHQLHEVLQLCMGWQDCHAHQFLVGKIFYEPLLEGREDQDRGKYDEAKFKLHQLEEGMRFLFTYIYDFGDGWEHQLHLEKVLPMEQGKHHAVLLEGERACPPEDVGGMFGYEHFLSAMADPDHREHRAMVDWYGGRRFDPEQFDAAGVNRALSQLG